MGRRKRATWHWKSQRQPPSCQRQPVDFTENLSKVATQNEISSHNGLKTQFLCCFNLRTLQIRGVNFIKLPEATSNLKGNPQAQWINLLFPEA